MTVWMFLDPFASMVAEDEAKTWNEENPDKPPKDAQDVEYERIEATFREGFPDEKDILFSRGKGFLDLKNGCPDFYVWDIGGMCYTDYSGHGRSGFSRGVVEQLKDHPDTWFVPWSAFTFRYVEGALAEEYGEDVQIDGRLPPNILILDEKEMYKGVLEETIMERLKAKYQARRRVDANDLARLDKTDGGRTSE